MKLLIFDTETTGLPKEKYPSIFDSKKWPYIVQLSYILYDNEEKKVIEIYDKIIKIPENVMIEKDAESIHKISKELTRISDVTINIALESFNRALQLSDIIIGHNLSFDKCLIMAECYRNNIRQYFTINNKRKKEYCTMKNTKELCKIERLFPSGDKYFKYPTLSELHFFLFGNIPENLHNSLIDIILCLRCYLFINNNFDIYDINKDIKLIIDSKAVAVT